MATAVADATSADVDSQSPNLPIPAPRTFNHYALQTDPGQLADLPRASSIDQISVDPKQLELKKKNIPWARLMARAFNIDVEICSKCGGKMKIIAAIEDPKVIRKILDHNGLPTKPPSLHPARGPPKQQNYFEDDFNQSRFEMNFDSLNSFSD